MDPQMRALIDDLLIEIRELGIEVSALVLFGSHSDGTATGGSDVDIAIISPSFHNLHYTEENKSNLPYIELLSGTMYL